MYTIICYTFGAEIKYFIPALLGGETLAVVSGVPGVKISRYRLEYDATLSEDDDLK